MIREMVLSFLAGLGVTGDQPAVQSAGLLYVYVLDGDTVKLPDGDKVRALGYDSPELEARCDHEYRLAAMASSKLWAIASDGLVVELTGRRDRYGRALGRLRTRSGKDVADIMVQAGLARRYHGGRHQSWCD